jgi:hypothetical protein
MLSLLTATAAALAATAVNPAPAITGQYIEARTCDVWTGPCFANAETHLNGRQAILAWRVERGSFAGANLDGLSVAAVIVASDTLGMDQTGPARAILIVDSRATTAQRDALIALARRQGGQLTRNVVAVQSAPVSLALCECKGGTCAELSAGQATIRTRCLTDHDRHCGNETPFYPPLTDGVTAQAAAAIEHGYRGPGLQETWTEGQRRGAYVGTFAVR